LGPVYENLFEELALFFRNLQEERPDWGEIF